MCNCTPVNTHTGHSLQTPGKHSALRHHYYFLKLFFLLFSPLDFGLTVTVPGQLVQNLIPHVTVAASILINDVSTQRGPLVLLRGTGFLGLKFFNPQANT